MSLKYVLQTGNSATTATERSIKQRYAKLSRLCNHSDNAESRGGLKEREENSGGIKKQHAHTQIKLNQGSQVKCGQSQETQECENVSQSAKQNTEIPSHGENRDVPSDRDMVCKMCVYVGWAHLAAGSLWGLGRFKARQLSDICLVNEAAGCAQPFALKKSSFAGTKMQRGWHCSMAALGWLGACRDGIGKRLWPSRTTLCRYQKVLTLEALRLGRAAEQQLSTPDFQKIFFSYPSANYSTFVKSHILK